MNKAILRRWWTGLIFRPWNGMCPVPGVPAKHFLLEFFGQGVLECGLRCAYDATVQVIAFFGCTSCFCICSDGACHWETARIRSTCQYSDWKTPLSRSFQKVASRKYRVYHKQSEACPVNMTSRFSDLGSRGGWYAKLLLSNFGVAWRDNFTVWGLSSKPLLSTVLKVCVYKRRAAKCSTFEIWNGSQELGLKESGLPDGPHTPENEVWIFHVYINMLISLC